MCEKFVSNHLFWALNVSSDKLNFTGGVNCKFCISILVKFIAAQNLNLYHCHASLHSHSSIYCSKKFYLPMVEYVSCKFAVESYVSKISQFHTKYTFQQMTKHEIIYISSITYYASRPVLLTRPVAMKVFPSFEKRPQNWNIKTIMPCLGSSCCAKYYIKCI